MIMVKWFPVNRSAHANAAAHFARADDNCDFFATYIEGCGDVDRDGYQV